MRKSKFTEGQIAFALRQAENGIKVEEVCRKMSVTEQTFYRWKKKFGGLGVSELLTCVSRGQERDIDAHPLVEDSLSAFTVSWGIQITMHSGHAERGFGIAAFGGEWAFHRDQQFRMSIAGRFVISDNAYSIGLFLPSQFAILVLGPGIVHSKTFDIATSGTVETTSDGITRTWELRDSNSLQNNLFYSFLVGFITDPVELLFIGGGNPDAYDLYEESAGGAVTPELKPYRTEGEFFLALHVGLRLTL